MWLSRGLQQGFGGDEHFNSSEEDFEPHGFDEGFDVEDYEEQYEFYDGQQLPRDDADDLGHDPAQHEPSRQIWSHCLLGLTLFAHFSFLTLVALTMLTLLALTLLTLLGRWCSAAVITFTLRALRPSSGPDHRMEVITAAEHQRQSLEEKLRLMAEQEARDRAKAFSQMSPMDFGSMLSSLSSDQVVGTLSQLKPLDASSTLINIDVKQRIKVLSSMSAEDIASIIEATDTDKKAHIFTVLPKEILIEQLESMVPEEMSLILSSMTDKERAVLLTAIAGVDIIGALDGIPQEERGNALMAMRPVDRKASYEELQATDKAILLEALPAAERCVCCSES